MTSFSLVLHGKAPATASFLKSRSLSRTQGSLYSPVLIAHVKRHGEMTALLLDKLRSHR